MHAPIVLFVYNRKEIFLRTYEALKNCIDADKSDLFIFSDGPKDEKSKVLVEDLRQQLKTIKTDLSFKKITIIESEKNKGLANSILDGVTQVINEYGSVIVLEDDCLPSEYLLRYMNSALDYYYEDKSIGSIAGYSEVVDIPSDYVDDIYLARRSCSWGWATWKDRWNDVDWDLDKTSIIFKSPKLIHRLNQNGSDRLMRLYRQTQKDTQSWSIRFGAHHVINDWFVICPRYSYIYCIGDDGSGVHTQKGEVGKQYDLSLAIPNPKMQKIKYDKRIQRLLKKRASNGAIGETKRFLAASAIVIKSNFGL